MESLPLGSRTNSNTSHQIPARVIEADSARAVWVPGRMVAGPGTGPTDRTGRSSGRDHSPLQWRGLGGAPLFITSPSAKAVVERLDRALGLPCASDALRAAEAKASHQVDLAIV